MPSSRSIEWPTLAVALAVHGLWLASTRIAAAASHISLLLLVAVPAGAFAVAWHGSLQHEIIHGHPTRSRALNTLLASLPVGLVLPFGIYRAQHLAHHGSRALTSPLDDPESFYVTRAWWTRAGRVSRALATAQTTLAGRLVLGPPVMATRFLAGELRAFARGDLRHARAWTAHLVGVALVLAWLHFVGLSLERYVLLFVYPGAALTLVRSFAEHRPAASAAHRSAIVEAGPVARLLFLNNTFHYLHHESPATPWYELPARYAARKSHVLAANGGFVVPGYLRLAARYGLRAKDAAVHPDG
jgi:fatty acid desaturase